MRLARPIALLSAAVLALSLAPSAHAANVLLHKRTAIAAASAPLDSTLWTLTTGASGALAGRDTLTAQGGTINTDAFSSGAPIDSLSDRGGVTAGKGFPHNLWVTVEVTGASTNLQSLDTLTCYVQYSQGQVPPATGQTNIFTAPTQGDPNSNPANWRWYDAVGSISALTGGVVALVNQAGTQTFVFPIPCAASDKNTWLAASNLRVVVVSDNSASAIAMNVRAWLTWRNQ